MDLLLNFDEKTIYAILSVVFSTIGFIPGLIGTWQIRGSKEVRPTISGWISWMLSDAAILAAMVARGNIAWQMVPYIVGSLSLIILSLRKGIKIAHMRGEAVSWKDAFMDWNRKDTVCVSIVVVAIAVWGIKHDPDYAIYLTIFSAIIGTLAIIRFLYNDPYCESFWAWVGFLIGGIFGVAAITEWTFAGSAVQILYATVQVTMVALTARRYLPRFAQA